MQREKILISNDDIQLHSEEELREIQKDMLAERKKDQILEQKQQLHTESATLQPHAIKSDSIDTSLAFWIVIFAVGVYGLLRMKRE
jgi:hypothetical protein